MVTDAARHGPGASTKPRKVYIVEDHPVFREGLVMILRREPDLTVCGVASDAETALVEIPKVNPDLVLVDISLPGKNGLELIKDLCKAKRKPKILVVSMHDEALYANRVLRAGGHGYIMKDEDPEELAQAIRDVLAGHIYVSEQILTGRGTEGSGAPRAETARPLDALSDFELEILEYIGRGEANGAIAECIGKTAKDVAEQCEEIKRKLKLKSSKALVRYAACWVETGRS